LPLPEDFRWHPDELLIEIRARPSHLRQVTTRRRLFFAIVSVSRGSFSHPDYQGRAMPKEASSANPVDQRVAEQIQRRRKELGITEKCLAEVFELTLFEYQNVEYQNARLANDASTPRASSSLRDY
jgi:hypothetical protein